jgi:hypothetical protein
VAAVVVREAPAADRPVGAEHNRQSPEQLLSMPVVVMAGIEMSLAMARARRPTAAMEAMGEPKAATAAPGS